MLAYYIRRLRISQTNFGVALSISYAMEDNQINNP